MSTAFFRRRALRIAAVAILLAGCDGFRTSIGAPEAVPQTLVHQLHAHAGADHSYVSLYSFKGSPDAAEPASALVQLNGVLYGSTAAGGLKSNSGFTSGTAFRITTKGQESVIVSFGAAGTYGYTPNGLVVRAGALYGTAQGGDPSYGIIFKITTTGQESVIYNFKGKPDGYIPDGVLTVVDGEMYGVTDRGGKGGYGSTTNHCRPGYYGCGTLFETRTAVNSERVVYSFRETHDAWFPFGNVAALDGRLYGTTSFGGVHDACMAHGCGAIYAVDKSSGKGHTLYGFKGPPNDAQYGGSLVTLGKRLYGVSGGGGSSGHGTIFSITPSGKEAILYNFTGGADGGSPSGLVVVNGFLYGTTQNGGTSTNCSGGCGTVFKMSTSGAEQVLHSFAGYPYDGSDPSANMIFFNGKLYGTTATGGSASQGTVFRVSP